MLHKNRSNNRIPRHGPLYNATANNNYVVIDHDDGGNKDGNELKDPQQEVDSPSPRNQTTSAAAFAAGNGTVCRRLTIHGNTGLARARALSHSQRVQSPIDTSDEKNQAPALPPPPTSAQAQSPSQVVQPPIHSLDDNTPDSSDLSDASSEQVFGDKDGIADEAAFHCQFGQDNLDPSENSQVINRATRSQTRNASVRSNTPSSVASAVAMAGSTLQQARTKSTAAASSSKKGGKQSAPRRESATAASAQKFAATKKRGSTAAGEAGDGRHDDEDDDRGDGSRKSPPSNNGLMHQPSDSDGDKDDNERRKKSRRKPVHKPNACHFEVKEGDDTIIVDHGHDSDFNPLSDEDDKNDLALVLPQSADDNSQNRAIASSVIDASNQNRAAVVAQVNNVAAAHRDITSHPLYAQITALRNSVASRSDSLEEGMKALSLNAQTLNKIVDELRETRIDLREVREQVKVNNKEAIDTRKAIANDQELDGRIADMLENLIVGPRQDMSRRGNLKRGRMELDDDNEEEPDRYRRRLRRTPNGYDVMETELRHSSTPPRQVAVARQFYESSSQHQPSRRTSRAPLSIDDIAQESDSDPEGAGVDVTGYLSKERKEAEAATTAASKIAPPAPRPPPASRPRRSGPRRFYAPRPDLAASLTTAEGHRAATFLAPEAVAARRGEIARRAQIASAHGMDAGVDDPYKSLTTAPGVIRPTQPPADATAFTPVAQTNSQGKSGVAQRSNPPPSPEQTPASQPAPQPTPRPNTRRQNSKATMPKNLFK